MLGGERQVGLVNELPYKPTLGQTAEASFEKPFLQVAQIKDYIFPGLSTKESRIKTAEKISAINEMTSDPRLGFGQKSLNAVSNLVGGMIPTLPLAVAGGAVVGGAATAIGFGARALALEAGSDAILAGYLGTQVPLANLAEGALSHWLPKVGAGAIAKGLAEAYGGYKGMIIPEHFAQHYNAIENSLDASHAIQDWGSDNYGFLLGGAPLAAGYVLYKGVAGVIALRAANKSKAAIQAELTRLLRDHEEALKINEVKEGEKIEREAKVSELQHHLQQAEDSGLITPEMHNWYLDYLENPHDMTNVHEGGLNVLKSLQIPYDRVTGRVWNEVLSRDGVKNLQGSLFDEGITNFSEEERQLLSSYVIHNELDGYIGNMRDNPNLLTALEGLTHHLGLKIEAQSAALKEFGYALSRHVPKGLLKKQIFSQHKIYQHLKKIGVYSPRDVPYHVPKSVSYLLKLEEQIKNIESRKTRQYELKYEKGKHLELKAKVKELKRNLLTPVDEMIDILNRLMPDNKLVSDFKNRSAYHRLEDLSQVWPNAKYVLDKIHMESINAKQKGLNEILKKFIEMVDENAARLANPDGVKRYLQSRIERSVPFTREFEQTGIEFKPSKEEIETTKIPKSDSLFNDETSKIIESTDLEFAKNDFEISEKRFKQFSENEEALHELIKCQLGEL